MKKILFIFFIFLFLSVNDVNAVTVSITNIPESISTDPFTITVNITGAGAGTNYLKAELYKDGTTNYFGETFNGTDWYKDSDGKKYLPVTIQSGIPFSGQLTTRMGSPSQAEYDGTGQYKLRVKRFTSSGNSAPSSETSASAVSINIVLPSPTAVPTSTPSPTSTIALLPTPTTTSPSNPTSTPTPTPQPTDQISYNNIFLSEVFPYPESGNEWVEIYNANDFSINLVNWYVDDVENTGSTPKIFSLNIGPKSYAVFELSSSVFNNDGDSVRLLDFNKLAKDSFEYSNSEKGKSFGRTSFSTDDFCLQNSTKGTINSACLNPTGTPTPSPKKTPTPSPSSKSTSTKETSTKVTPSNQNLSVGNFSQPGKINQEPSSQKVGEVLGEETEIDAIDRDLVYVQAFSTSSALISTINIFYVIHKIIRRLKYEKD